MNSILPKDVAVRVNDVHKIFHLPHQHESSIKTGFVNIFKKKQKGSDIHYALNGITFDIKKGEFFGIVGRNGSGKSTLLKIISKIYQPSSGTADYRGKLVAFIELGVGFNSELTARENVYLNAAMLGFSRTETTKMYEEIVEFAELEEFMDQKLNNFSSGMKVRLAFSVAIRAKADILVLDEVLAVGDPDFKRKCYNYFQNLKEAHKTIILVSHSMNLIKEYCDRAILIENGVIAHEGYADDVADEYTKLFNKPINENKKLEGDKRWGDQSIIIDELSVNISEDNSMIDIIVRLKAASKPVKNVKFGFKVKDGQDKLIAGASNLNVKGAQKMHFEANESKELVFSMPNIFGSKSYSISAIVKAANGSIVCDSWENAAHIFAPRENVFYPVVCPAILKIRK